MKIMGLSSLAYNLSWFITMVVQLALTALLMTLLSARTVFAYSSPVWIWLFLMSFSVAVIMFCFVVSTFFSKSKTAATLGASSSAPPPLSPVMGLHKAGMAGHGAQLEC